MGRRTLGLALMSLALVVPATASARSVETPKVLVVTSTDDAFASAGKAAITAASAGGSAFEVTAPAPADVGARFTAANLDGYRAVVFLNPRTGASTLTSGATSR